MGQTTNLNWWTPEFFRSAKISKEMVNLGENRKPRRKLPSVQSEGDLATVGK